MKRESIKMRLAFSQMRAAFFKKQGAFAPTASRILENARRIFFLSVPDIFVQGSKFKV